MGNIGVKTKTERTYYPHGRTERLYPYPRNLQEIKELQEFISEVYRGAEENAASVVDDVDFEELRSRIGEVKGVGEARLNDIMDVIKEYFGS